MITNSFQNDLEYFYQKLINKERFSFSKYADGEYAILFDQAITNCDNWTYNPNNADHRLRRIKLINSFTNLSSDYYIGISCPCCQPKINVDQMKKLSGRSDDRLTWANIFVNSNYKAFVNKWVPEFSNHRVVLFSRWNSKVENLPFNIELHVPVSENALMENDFLSDFAVKEYDDFLFLFCAGPLGNVLASTFWNKNKNNTYLDIGSTLNPWLTECNRSYLSGGQSLNKVCAW